MGYTHYWNQPVNKPIPADKWARIVEDANHLMAAAPCPLWHEYDEPGTRPEITGDRIWFNGAGDDGHETFCLESEPAQHEWSEGDPYVFTFCKTARKPYDLIVVAVLACAEEHAGPEAGGFIAVSSDGTEDEWRTALAWASTVLGRTVPMPARVRDDAPCEPMGATVTTHENSTDWDGEG